ncbi:MAG TPA: hypothetical protein VGC15_05285 [Acetobacteraceae bacterium]
MPPQVKLVHAHPAELGEDGMVAGDPQLRAAPVHDHLEQVVRRPAGFGHNPAPPAAMGQDLRPAQPRTSA